VLVLGTPPDYLRAPQPSAKVSPRTGEWEMLHSLSLDASISRRPQCDHPADDGSGHLRLDQPRRETRRQANTSLHPRQRM